MGVIEGIDVSDSDAGTKLVEAVQKQLGEGGTLDYVICNAGCVCVCLWFGAYICSPKQV